MSVELTTAWWSAWPNRRAKFLAVWVNSTYCRPSSSLSTHLCPVRRITSCKDNNFWMACFFDASLRSSRERFDHRSSPSPWETLLAPLIHSMLSVIIDIAQTIFQKGAAKSKLTSLLCNGSCGQIKLVVITLLEPTCPAIFVSQRRYMWQCTHDYSKLVLWNREPHVNGLHRCDNQQGTLLLDACGGSSCCFWSKSELGNMDVQDTDDEWIKVQGKKKKKEATSTVKATWLNE